MENQILSKCRQTYSCTDLAFWLASSLTLASATVLLLVRILFSGSTGRQMKLEVESTLKK